MIPELGHFALVLALLLALSQSWFGLVGAMQDRTAWMRAAQTSVAGQWWLLLLSFAALVWSFIQFDFSVAYVANTSNSLLPLFYRIAAAWGGHEGSLLLWALILASWSAAIVAFSRQMPLRFRSRVLGILGLVSVGFILFMLSTSNPFDRLMPAAPEGRDLNPLLQDFALAVHPPTLYLGYVGLAVPFAFACATLLEGRQEVDWARWARPWTLVAWLCLTVGITLGSWWAYYELGWGGYWFWDPVENASFMPWLMATALVHSLAVTEKRGLFRSWTLLLAVSAFSLSLLGTFLVRSGVLVSVHAFATDPSRGLFILGFLVVVIGGALTLYAWRAPSLQAPGGFSPTSREAFLLFNNALLVAATGLILVGTLYPLFMDALGLGKISVGPPYFGVAFLVPMVPLLLLMVFGMHAAWKYARLGTAKRPLLILLPFALLAAVGLILAGYDHFSLAAFAGFGVALWLMGSSLIAPWQRRDRWRSLPAGFWGMTLAHFGVGLFTLGVTGVESYRIERDLSLAPGESATLMGYDFRFEGTREVQGPNYAAVEGLFTVTREGQPVTVLTSQKRLYASGGNPMTEAGIHVSPRRDLFVALGEDLGAGKWSMRLQYKPLIRYVWLGALLMALGGLVATADRRYRVQLREEEAAHA
ncbi:MAG: heme lyase CcmF/NrfE family subunit [Steroidobacteraceae bacterium]